MRNGQKRMRGRGNNHRKSQNPLTRVYNRTALMLKFAGLLRTSRKNISSLRATPRAPAIRLPPRTTTSTPNILFRLIAAAQEQFRQQNPYYNQQPQQGAPGGQHQQGSTKVSTVTTTTANPSWAKTNRATRRANPSSSRISPATLNHFRRATNRYTIASSINRSRNIRTKAHMKADRM